MIWGVGWPWTEVLNQIAGESVCLEGKRIYAEGGLGFLPYCGSQYGRKDALSLEKK